MAVNIHLVLKNQSEIGIIVDRFFEVAQFGCSFLECRFDALPLHGALGALKKSGLCAEEMQDLDARTVPKNYQKRSRGRRATSPRMP
jgi:hypothetical protein